MLLGFFVPYYLVIFIDDSDFSYRSELVFVIKKQ